MASNNRQSGLSSLRQQQQIRRRALVHGKVGMRDSNPQFWVWTFVVFGVFGVVYWYYSERQLEHQKAKVMARQRAVSQELGPRLLPLRKKVETWVAELAGEWGDSYVEPGLALEKLSQSDGIYLRMELGQTIDSERLRKAAERSQHDGFTSCLFERAGRFKSRDGKRCSSPAQCPAGELCNEWSVCAAPSQPFNLRLMYRALGVLSPDWTDRLHQAQNDFQVRVFDHELEKVTKVDVPIAIDLVTAAKHFTALLDDTSALDMAARSSKADAGLEERRELQVQALPHPVRLGIWDLETGQQLVRLKAVADARFVPMGRSHALSEKSLRAQQRQVNNCSVAAELRDKMRAGAKAPATVTASAGAPPASSAKPASSSSGR